MKRALFLQYTNPAGYPPLEHASHILVGEGWSTRFLGVALPGVEDLVMPPLNGRSVSLAPLPGKGLRLKLSYLAYVVRSALACVVWRPQVIYASDPNAALPALIGRTLCGARLIYHEHDAPLSAAGFLGRAYHKLVREAELCIAPQAERLKLLLAATGRTGKGLCVWNTPAKGEAGPARAVQPGRPLAFYFHGTINPARLPLTIVDALRAASEGATLTIAGYEPGRGGHVKAVLDHAAALGMAGRVRYIGAIAGRADLLAAAAAADVGLAFMPARGGDVNMVHMVGASNKPFDYLSQGLMLLVSDLAEWRQTFVDPGYGMACDPSGVESLTAAMRWCVEHRPEVAAMGEKGRARILSEWNYETAFRPVLMALDAAA